MSPKKTYKLNKRDIKNKLGGEVIASGGFGCVFKPALACANGIRKSNGVSKLMTLKHANAEYDEITQIKDKLNKIPNYLNYFLIDDIDNLCIPAKLDDSDLRNFQEKCSALKKDDYTVKNINASLNELRVLSMPDGGITLKEYILKIRTLNQIQELNISLIDLFEKGISPMNKRDIYHSDIKDTNILVDATNDNLQPRLIDWGLTTEYPLEEPSHINDNNIHDLSWLPSKWKNKSIQFNVPFSIIMFSSDFLNQYNAYLKTYGVPKPNNKKYIVELDKFITTYLFYWMETGKGIGHIVTINKTIEMLYDLTKSSDNQTNVIVTDPNEPDESYKVSVYVKTIEIITVYIRNILIEYTHTKNAEPAINDYVNNAFINNIDKWGFVTTYLPFLKMNFKDNLDKYKNEKVFNIIKDTLLFLYETSARAISEKEITTRLNAINQLVGGTITKQNNKKYSKKIGKNTCKHRIKLSNRKKTRTRKRN
jgi:serine/threonine protein kinase